MKNYKLFSNCIIVSGVSRSTICDLQRNKFELIPNSLATLFDENYFIDLESLAPQLDEDDLFILNEYLDLLVENEFIFECDRDEIELFPKLNLDFDYPSEISNMIFDFDNNSIQNENNIADLANHFPNAHLQLRFFNFFDEKNIVNFVKKINCKTIEIIYKDSEHIDSFKILNANDNISVLTLYAANSNEIIESGNNGFGIIIKTKDVIIDEKNCGIINHSYFNVAIESFSESQSHNSCLNRKLSIDKNGNIKNCPAMTISFGHISITSVDKALKDKNFKKYWNINKDQIDICKDCEFRYICTDCRAFVEEPNNDFSKPLKCGYNPYTNEWENWSTSQLKQKAIAFYGL